MALSLISRILKEMSLTDDFKHLSKQTNDKKSNILYTKSKSYNQKVRDEKQNNRQTPTIKALFFLFFFFFLILIATIFKKT